MGLDDYRRMTDVAECTSCSRMGGGIIELRLEYFMLNSDVRMRRTIKVDPANDFAPVEMSCGRLPGGTRPWHAAYGMTRCRTDWERVAGAWVPVKCTFDGPLPRDNGVAELSWASVNQRLPEQTFTPEGLNVPAGTAVFDHRLGAPVLDRFIGNENEPIRAILRRKREARWLGWRTWVALANGAVIVALAAAALVRRMR